MQWIVFGCIHLESVLIIIAICAAIKGQLSRQHFYIDATLTECFKLSCKQKHTYNSPIMKERNKTNKTTGYLSWGSSIERHIPQVDVLRIYNHQVRRNILVLLHRNRTGSVLRTSCKDLGPRPQCVRWGEVCHHYDLWFHRDFPFWLPVNHVLICYLCLP